MVHNLRNIVQIRQNYCMIHKTAELDFQTAV